MNTLFIRPIMSANNDLNDQKSRILDLCQRLQLPQRTGPEGTDLDELERTLRYLAAIEEEPCSTLSRQLISSGINLPEPSTLTPAGLHQKLWEVIHGLARQRTLLSSTDHLSDHELYSHLWNTVLNEPAYELDDFTGDCATHIDLLGGGDEDSTFIHLKYYADDFERDEWRSNFPEDVMPEHVDLPYDRDRLLPQRSNLTKLHAAITFADPFEDPHYQKAWEFAALGQYREAHAELDQITDEPEINLDLTARRLELFLLEGRWKEATIPGEFLCEFDPDNPDHFINYAHALDQLGQTGEALQVLYLAPEEIKRLPVYHYNSACYEALTGETELAISYLKRACKMDKKFLTLAKNEPALACIRLQLPQRSE